MLMCEGERGDAGEARARERAGGFGESSAGGDDIVKEDEGRVK